MLPAHPTKTTMSSRSVLHLHLLMTLTLTASLTLYSSSCTADPISEEMKCLDTKPVKACSIKVSYPEYLDNLECDQKIPSEDGSLLKTVPKLVVPSPKGEFPAPVLVLMFDPDIPTTVVGEGFVHWVARGKMDKEGEITDLTPLPELEYYPPSPPQGENHRYQVFIYRVDADKNIAASPSPDFIRLDHLCQFMSRNTLPKPIASTQFWYQSE